MTDFLQDQAALYALCLLDPEEARALEQQMASDPALATLVQELQNTLAETTLALPVANPRSALRERVLNQIRDSKETKAPKSLRSSSSGFANRLGWGLAAAFAVSAAWLYSERTRLDQTLAVVTSNEASARVLAQSALTRAEVAEKSSETARNDAQTLRNSLSASQTSLTQLTSELQALQERNNLAQMQIAMLQSTVSEFQNGVAVVVWDSEKEQGILKLEKMPPIAADKDYQLWVVDPAKPKTVDAGIVRVDSKGFARVEFKPVVDVSEAAKFAVSIERKGGVPENEGPVILVGP